MKEKGIAENTARFVSSLPLEACVYRLESLCSEALQLEITHLSSDKVDFVVQLHERNRLRAEGFGTLRRWEGTLTRVDFDVQVYDGLWLWLVAVLVMLTVSMVLVPVLLMLSLQVNPVGWLLMGSVVVGFIVGMMWLAQQFAPPDDTPLNLLQLLHDTLTD